LKRPQQFFEDNPKNLIELFTRAILRFLRTVGPMGIPNGSRERPDFSDIRR
jgi:hypothetical protein